MIKFEKINGQLCRMLEQPIPLTEKSKFPCVVGYIKDDSFAGRLNKSIERNIGIDYIDTTFIANAIKNNPLYRNARHAYDAGNMCIEPIDQLEILGYPVADGSKEWALWQMQNGKAVCHTKAPSIKYSVPTHYVKRSVRENCTDDMSIEVWLSGSDGFGWQIYTEPKPLLADAKVGDLVTIKTKHGELEYEPVFHVTDTSVYAGRDGKINRYYEYSKIDGTCAMDNRFLIVAIEPLAAEGSAEWAWQMWCLLEKEIAPVNFTAKTYRELNPKKPCITCFYAHDVNYWKAHKDEWLHYAESTQWQLYEPKQEPCPACNGTGKVEKPAPAFRVGDWVTDGVINGSITSLTDDLAWVKTEFYEYRMSLRNLTPISSSEIVIHIGCLSGTVRSRDNKSFHLLRKGKNTMVIYFDALDTHTRKLVQELIEKQEEK